MTTAPPEPIPTPNRDKPGEGAGKFCHFLDKWFRCIGNRTEYDPNNNVTLTTETKIGVESRTDITTNTYDSFDRISSTI